MNRKNNRTPGYYFCLACNNEWTVCEWLVNPDREGRWYMTGDPEAFDDDNFIAIGDKVKMPEK